MDAGPNKNQLIMKCVTQKDLYYSFLSSTKTMQECQKLTALVLTCQLLFCRKAMRFPEEHFHFVGIGDTTPETLQACPLSGLYLGWLVLLWGSFSDDLQYGSSVGDATRKPARHADF